MSSAITLGFGSVASCLVCRKLIGWCGQHADSAAKGLGMTKRIAIGGFGAIGKLVAQRLDQPIEGLKLTAIAARNVSRAEAAMTGFVRSVPVVPLEQLWEHADVVVECAPAAVLRELAEPALTHG